MQQITEIIIVSATGILTVLAGIAVKLIKDFLIKKGGEKTIKIVEILLRTRSTLWSK